MTRRSDYTRPIVLIMYVLVFIVIFVGKYCIVHSTNLIWHPDRGRQKCTIHMYIVPLDWGEVLLILWEDLIWSDDDWRQLSKFTFVQNNHTWMHFAIFSRLSSYGNYSVRVEVLKPALNQQNYLRASLSTQVKVGRKAEEISTTFSPFFLNISICYRCPRIQWMLPLT